MKKPTSHLSTDWDGKTLLIIEDDDINLELVKINLDDTPVSLVHKYTGQEALDYLKLNEVDVILTDIELPDINGFDLIGRIREFCSAPVVAYSALVIESYKEKAIRLGFEDFLDKPIKKDLLITVFNSCFSK